MQSPLPSILFWSLILLIGAIANPGAAISATPAEPNSSAVNLTAAAPTGLTTDQTQQLLSVLQDPQKRGQLITTLQNLQKVLQTTGTNKAPATTTSSAAPPSGTSPAAQSTTTAAPEVALDPNGLGADLLSQADDFLNEASTLLVSTAETVTAYRQFKHWANRVRRDPAMLAPVIDTSWRLALVLAVALLAEYAVRCLSGPLYRHLGRESEAVESKAKSEALPPPEEPPAMTETEALAAERAAESRGQSTVPASLQEPPHYPARVSEAPGMTAPVRHRQIRPRSSRTRPFYSGWLLLLRLPFILLAAAVDAMPPLAFLAAGTIVLATPLISDGRTRLTISEVITAYVLCRLLLVVARAAFCAPSPKLRSIQISNESAAFLAIWCWRLAIVIFLGYCIVHIGGLSGMPLGLRRGIGRIFGLVFHVMLVVMVLRRRHEVEAWLRGPPAQHPTAWQKMKARLASVWHWQAIVIIMLVWFIYATRVSNSVEHPLGLILLTVGMLILFRVLHIIVAGAIDKMFTMPGRQAETRYATIVTRARRYHRPLRVIVNIGFFALFILTLLQIWGLNAFSWLNVGGLGGQLLSSIGTMLVTLVLAIVIWEAINSLIQIYMDELEQHGAYVRAARLRTVMPLLRNTLLVALFVIFVLTVVSIIGVNIGPLLAGASIIGVALGFGSQKLVQDFINGIFLLLENAMQVGDWVTAGGLSGTVETLSIRTLRLRAGDGSVHIIPFSSVTTVTNTNRGLGNAAVSVTISYEEDTDRAAELLKQIVLELRQEEAFKRGMLSDFQYWGVDKIDGTTATLAGQVVCTDTARWNVQRELNRRIKIAFQEHGIRIIPSSTVLTLQHPLDVRVDKPEPRGRETAT